MPKEIPILFSTEMVKAILDGRKVMTRRVIKGGFDSSIYNSVKILTHSSKDVQTQAYFFNEGDKDCWGIKLKWSKGDILYVRETWQHTDCINLSRDDENSGYIYKASENGREWENSDEEWRWKPGIHLPKLASRIWLEVTDVKVERLHDIAEEDAISEGVERIENAAIDKGFCYKNYGVRPEVIAYYARFSFRTLWISINGDESWESNPWVWCVSFRVLSTTGRPVELQDVQECDATNAKL